MKLRQRQTSRSEVSHRVIPQEVVEQLRAHLESSPDHIRRMILLLVEYGMRVSEVCSLPFDCLEQRSGLLWLGTTKTGKQRAIPLSPSTVVVVQEQQQALLQEPHGRRDLLFRDTTGQAVSPRTLLFTLNRLAIEKDIRDRTGDVWRFRSLQFRSTLAMHMMMQQIPMSVIQQYFGYGFMLAPSAVTLLLGHSSSAMNLRYLHLTSD